MHSTVPHNLGTTLTSRLPYMCVVECFRTERREEDIEFVVVGSCALVSRCDGGGGVLCGWKRKRETRDREFVDCLWWWVESDRLSLLLRY